MKWINEIIYTYKGFNYYLEEYSIDNCDSAIRFKIVIDNENIYFAKWEEFHNFIDAKIRDERIDKIFGNERI